MFPLLYLDPGTGSLLLYALIGVSATAFFTLRGVWYSLKGLFVRGTGSQALPKELPPLIIHSEGAKYWQVFQPVVKELDKRGIPFAYVTPDKKDFELAAAFGSAVPVHPGNEMATIAYMNRIKGDLVITTTPHLDIYMLKRSKHVNKYAHLVHAPTSVDFYEKFAFNRFDIILSPGPFMEPFIRELEAMWNLPAKEVYSTGCTYFDYMKEQMVDSPEVSEQPAKVINRKTVLYAPTWGQRSSLIKYGIAIMEEMAKGDYDLIFRPHPQFYVSHKEEIAAVEKWIETQDHVSLDINRTGVESMEKADLMITDLSGVLFDYAYLYEKPILLMDVDISLKGFEGEGLSLCWDKKMCEELSRLVRGEEIPEFPRIIEETLGSGSDHSERIRSLRDRELTAFGESGVCVTNAIEKILAG